jgi:hypothetical protein
MAKCRPKVVIEYVRWDGMAGTANNFVGEAYGTDWEYRERGSDGIWIMTRAGKMNVNVGDYLLKYSDGRVASCDAEHFEKTFEPL